MKSSPAKFLTFVAVCSLIASLSSISIAQAEVTTSYDWTTLQGDGERTGYTESPAPDSNQTYWKFQTGGAIISSPVVSEGMVFVASTDGYLYAVNVTNGVKIWDFLVGKDANSPTVAHGKVFITSASGTAYGINMYTGIEEWTNSLEEEAGFGAPLIVGSRVFVNGNHTVFSFNEAVGVHLYSEALPHTTSIAPLTYDAGSIVSVVLRGAAIRLDKSTFRDGMGYLGVTVAPTDIELLRSGATIGGEKTFVVNVNSNGSSTVFGLNDFGISDWKHQLDGATEASPAFAYDTLYIPTSNSTYALDAENGTVKWSRPLDGGYSVSSPAVADGKVYFGLDNGYVYALDALTGDIVWSYKTDGAVQSSPAISDGLLFVGSNDGNLYAIGTSIVPEFPSWTSMPFLLVTLSVALIIYKRRLAKKPVR
jgi:serine/threonine-protein kinase